MTMLDDDRLTSLFGAAAAAFEVPQTGSDEILARAAGRQAAGVEDDRTGTGDGDGDGDGDGCGNDGPDDFVDGPDGRVDRIPPRGHIRHVAAVVGRHRVVSAAACIVLVLALAGVVGALVRSPARPADTAALSHPSVQAPVHTPANVPSTTTTVPAFSSNGLEQRNAAPSAGTHGTASGPATTTPTTATPTTATNLPPGAVGQPAKIQQTGALTLTVGRGKLGQTVTQLTALATANGGFVANSQSQSGAGGGGVPTGSVTLQVPVQNFATVLARAQALGRTSALSTKATDVTGQYVDLQARIAALQASRQQYLTILAKATTVGDVLSVQEQIDTLQSQIEQLQGQLQLLTSQTSYSTLTVTVNERGLTHAAPSGPVPESGLVRAWHASVSGFVAGVEGLIRVAGPVLFALLLLGVVLAGGRALWRRYQRHNL